MSGASVLPGAHNFVANNGTFHSANTVSRVVVVSMYKRTQLIVWQMHIHNTNNSNKTTSNGVIPLMPNPSNQFTGWKAVITKLKRHFFTKTNDASKKRKFFLLHGMGGIGKTQICLKFLEDMSDQ